MVLQNILTGHWIHTLLDTVIYNQSDRNINRSLLERRNILYVGTEKALIKQNQSPIKVYSFVQDGMTPLYIACSEGHNLIVDILLKSGANVNQACTVGLR